MSRIIRIICFCIALLSVFTLTACQNGNNETNFEDHFEFSWFDGGIYAPLSRFSDSPSGYIVTAYSGNDPVVVIPSEFEGLPVRYINFEFFEDEPSDDIKYMMPEVIKFIIPSTILYIDFSLFYKMPNLEQIEIDGGSTEEYLSRDGILYSKSLDNSNDLILMYIPHGRTKDVVIESDVTTIKAFVFDHASKVSNLIINKDSSLTDISYLEFFSPDPDHAPSLDAVYVDQQQYDAMLALFAINNVSYVPIIVVNNN